jgi:hypothetical protein
VYTQVTFEIANPSQATLATLRGLASEVHWCSPKYTGVYIGVAGRVLAVANPSQLLASYTGVPPSANPEGSQSAFVLAGREIPRRPDISSRPECVRSRPRSFTHLLARDRIPR